MDDRYVRGSGLYESGKAMKNTDPLCLCVMHLCLCVMPLCLCVMPLCLCVMPLCLCVFVFSILQTKGEFYEAYRNPCISRCVAAAESGICAPFFCCDIRYGKNGHH